MLVKNDYFYIGTYVPNWENSKLITFTFRRYGSVGSATLPTELILAGVAIHAVYVYFGASMGCAGIDVDGKLTVKTDVGDGIYCDVYAIF